MPLIRHKRIVPAGELGIWKVEEPLAFYDENLELFEEERVEVAALSARKKLEWMATRYLLHYMTGQKVRTPCLKDKFGKPHLKDSNYKISISHSGDLVAVIASPFHVGVDVQYLVPKITRIAQRFCTDEEYEFALKGSFIENLHIIWGAKECLYKAYGRRQIDFKNQLKVNPFSISMGDQVATTAVLIANHHKRNFNIFSTLYDNYILVYAIENQL